MNPSWSDIAETYRNRALAVNGGEGFRQALVAMGHLAEHIHIGNLGKVLFGTTSMHDLCVQPADLPLSLRPHLRIAPLPSSRVSFRYIDTAIARHQWHREVDAAGAIPRLEGFVEQLGWARALAWSLQAHQ